LSTFFIVIHIDKGSHNYTINKINHLKNATMSMGRYNKYYKASLHNIWPAGCMRPTRALSIVENVAKRNFE